MKPRVAIFCLSSDFGCQVQMSNYPKLLEMLSTFELVYWQLVSSAPHPDEYEVAIIEGAVTTDEQIELLETIRRTASCVIVIGACAATGGIPGLAAEHGIRTQIREVYGAQGSKVAPGARKPAPVHAYIDVDFTIPGCPIDPDELSRVLQRALRNLVDNPQRQSLCGECKIAENICLWTRMEPCLGLIARSGCHATCVSRGRACMACRGIARDANLESAYGFAAVHGCDGEAFDRLIDIYNAVREVAP
jgi:coenzyme F420-reducing hydrogenase gamma subunit